MSSATISLRENRFEWTTLVPFESLSAALFGATLVIAVLFHAIQPSSFSGPWLFMGLTVQVLVLTSMAFVHGGHRGLARLGFHFGMLSYYYATPLFFPSSVESISDDIHRDLGATLLLTVIGFEFAYWRWQRRSVASSRPTIRDLPLLSLATIGLVAAIASLVIRAMALNVSIESVVYSMRGEVWAASVSQVNPWIYYLLFVLSSAAYLGSAAAGGYLVQREKSGAIWQAILCWSVLISTAGLGLRQGSRSLFLYSVVPVVATTWELLSRSAIRKTRWLVLAALAMGILAVWGFMSAARGRDVRDFAGTWEDMRPETHAQAAFDIYSATAVIVEAFPSNFEYEHGKSLVPVFLGWVPRTLWPGKPYPFGAFANYANWETIEHRNASIAVGLPGEGYGNFGILGGLLWGMLTGWGCAALDRYSQHLHGRNPLRLQIAMTSAVWAAMIVRGGVAEMFYMGLFVIFWPLLLAQYLERRPKAAPAR